MTQDHTPYGIYYLLGKYRPFACTQMKQKAPLTSALGARTAVFAVPSAFHTPWLGIVAAPLLALGCFSRRRE